MANPLTVFTSRQPAELTEELRREAVVYVKNVVRQGRDAAGGHARSNGEQHLAAFAGMAPFNFQQTPESLVDDLIAGLSTAFRSVADMVDADAFWQACRSLTAARLLPEALTSRMAALVWLERNPSPLPDEEWLQTLPTRLQPDLQLKIQQARQAAMRKRSPITSEAASQQLEAFRQSRAQRFA